MRNIKLNIVHSHILDHPLWTVSLTLTHCTTLTLCSSHLYTVFNWIPTCLAQLDSHSCSTFVRYLKDVILSILIQHFYLIHEHGYKWDFILRLDIFGWLMKLPSHVCLSFHDAWKLDVCDWTDQPVGIWKFGY